MFHDDYWEALSMSEEIERLKRQHQEELFNAVQQAERPIMAENAKLKRMWSNYASHGRDLVSELVDLKAENAILLSYAKELRETKETLLDELAKANNDLLTLRIRANEAKSKAGDFIREMDKALEDKGDE